MTEDDIFRLWSFVFSMDGKERNGVLMGIGLSSYKLVQFLQFVAKKLFHDLFDFIRLEGFTNKISEICAIRGK